MERKDPEAPASKQGGQEKKPYEAPRLLYREKLEVMAALCTPSPPAKANPGTCPQGPVSS